MVLGMKRSIVLLGIATMVTLRANFIERSLKVQSELFTIEKTNQTCTAFALTHEGFLNVCKITVNHMQCILSGSDDGFKSMCLLNNVQ